MTPEQLDKILAIISGTIETKIDSKVNGKIDSLRDLVLDHNEKHEAGMKEVREHIVEGKPILETYRGFNSVGNLVKWVAGVGTAIGVIWLMVRSLWQ